MDTEFTLNSQTASLNCCSLLEIHFFIRFRATVAQRALIALHATVTLHNIVAVNVNAIPVNAKQAPFGMCDIEIVALWRQTD